MSDDDDEELEALLSDFGEKFSLDRILANEFRHYVWRIHSDRTRCAQRIQ